MDITCGGSWWRSTAEEALKGPTKRGFEPVTHAVANEYARRLAAATASFPVTVPVRRRLHHQPIYHLIFLTRSPYGLWVFADAIGEARKVYLQHLGRLEDDEPDVLFTREDDMSWLMENEHEKAVAVVAANIRRLLERRGGRPFKLVDEVVAVFGEAYGYATEAAVTEALRRLESNGVVTVSRDRRVRERTVGAAFPLRPRSGQ